MNYIIGIGTNIGFTLENIRSAVALIDAHKDIRTIKKAALYSSDALLKKDSPKEWNIKFLNTAVKIKTSLKPEQLLVALKEIEQSIGRDLNSPAWSPRVMDLDILAADDLVFETDGLSIPHKELINRNFALAPLLDLDRSWQHPKYAEFNPQIRLKELGHIDKLNQTLSNTMRMGIINICDQSFSDGHFDDSQRKTNLENLIESGAEIIDIGAESTKPSATTICVDEEFQKLDDFLEYLKSQLTNFKYRPLISIDTRKYEVMEKVLEKHHDIVWMINDVEGNDIIKKAQLIAKYNKTYVITHNLGIDDRSDYLENENVIKEVNQFIESKKQILISNGVKQENIYFDVGFGFGKKQDVALHLLNKIDNVKSELNLKALVGHSRKPSVLGLAKDSSIDELDKATIELSSQLQKQKVDIIRVHKI
ncbi:dihydropteroate synthase [Francisella sp. Scap27]|uniref:dihydropteroate synthase n=1 Tax=Francisella sp. Scap27 TaxID=2589986 RepID=UPI0015C1AE5B|nr:dihydropteroate synthase [Francisella sp. Scap27]QLE78419.1 dihydropteroate synthase [Francisella sp. Scap27]